MDKAASFVAHGTQQELSFLEGLGRWHGALPRLELLRRYKAAMALRTDWRGIDPRIVAAFADQLISQLSAAWSEKEFGTGRQR